jgi:thiol:disulfide interchange protein DsbD
MRSTRFRRATAFAAVFLAFAVAGPATAIDLDSFGSPVTISTYSSLNQIPQGGLAHVAVELRINSPWHINAHDLDDEFLVPTEVAFETPDGITVTQVVYPAGHEMKLDFAEEPMMLYAGTVLVGAVVEVAPGVAVGDATIKAVVTYQACDNQKCLLPETETVFVPIRISTPHEAVDLVNGEVFEQIEFAAGATADGGSSFGAKVASRGLFAMFALVFLGGLALNLTPCVFPIIPITVGYFGNQSGGRMSKTVLLAVLYLLGMATMYSALGLVAALTGSLFGSALQNPIVLVFIAMVMVTLSLSMFGVYEIRVPMRLAGAAGTAKSGIAGSFLMGLTVGIVAAPCIGPFVLGLLTFVGEMGRPVLGFLLFFTLAVGLGLPYVFLAVASGSMSKLPRSGEWMEWVRRGFGVALVAMAVYFLRPLLGDPLYFGVMGAVLVVGGVVMGFVLKVGSKVLFVSALRRFVGVAAPLYGLYLILTPGHIIARDAASGIPWQPYEASALERAVKDGRPVVIDFSADWCLPCKELEHKTFNQPEVVDAARGMVPLRADLTRSSSVEVKQLREQYRIRGVPTVVFIDSTGKERDDLRVVQFVDKEEFLKRLADLRG